MVGGFQGFAPCKYRTLPKMKAKTKVDKRNYNFFLSKDDKRDRDTSENGSE